MISRSPYRIGELDQVVTFKREVETSDGMGGQTIALRDFLTCRAHVRPRGGSERDYADRLNAESTYLVVIRYREGLDESMRLVWQGEQYNIRFLPRTGGRPLYLELEAERGVAQ